MSANAQKINIKSALAYSLLPGVIPRVKALGRGGFAYLAFLYAVAFRAVRILPAGHPYLNPKNQGTFGLLDVIRVGSHHVHLTKNNFDQIIVFFALIAALVIMALQTVLVLFSLMTGSAFAAPSDASSFTSMFQTPNPLNDIALSMLDLVFGIPAAGGGMGPSLGFFGSNAIPLGASSFHQGLHALFHFYNLSILLVGVVIFLYYVVVVVVETAQTGVPFGARFAKLYAPIRLVIAVGMLVPLNYGFNGAQYISMYVAKLGSAFATNGWILYNETLLNPTGGSDSELVAYARAPTIQELIYFSGVYHSCKEIYKIWSPKNGKDMSSGGREIKPYVIVGNEAKELTDFSYTMAKNHFGKSDMEIVLGEQNSDEHKKYAGGVRPYCGVVTVSLSNDNPQHYLNVDGGGGGKGDAPSGVRAIEATYYAILQLLLKNNPRSKTQAFGERMAHTAVSPGSSLYDACWKSDVLGDSATCNQSGKVVPQNSVIAADLQSNGEWLKTSLDAAYSNYVRGIRPAISDEIKNRGWGGAGIWYNHIADMNGSFTSAIYALPTVKSYPEMMEFVRSKKGQAEQSNDACHMFEPTIIQGNVLPFPAPSDLQIARATNNTFQYFVCNKANTQVMPEEIPEEGSPVTTDCPAPSFSARANITSEREPNPIISIINLIFGTNGLFDLRTASCWDAKTGRPSINPLAQMATLGRSLLENAIRSTALAIGFSFGGGLLGGLNASIGAGLQTASSMLISIASIGITAGFLLYFVLPFLPFLYFFFAVGGWVKSIFEAMVGAPLWALAHLHIDGDGIPGQAAMSGYFLLFEIMLRPLFIVFGLICGMAAFTAMAGILNNIFDLVILNTSGINPTGTADGAVGALETFRRGVIDQFFFTVMYAILVYMMATSSFKMIDMIPSGVMRWLGTGVNQFNDNTGDPTAGLTGYTTIAVQQFASPVMQGVTGAAGGIGGLGGTLISSMKK